MYVTLLSRAEEAERKLAIAEVLSEHRAAALIAADRRIAELEAANKYLKEKLHGRDKADKI